MNRIISMVGALIVSMTFLTIATNIYFNNNGGAEFEGDLDAYIEVPVLPEMFVEGFPKDIKARVFIGIEPLEVGASFFWHSDLNGNLGIDSAISTEYLSIGNHHITLNVTYDGETVSDSVSVTKIDRLLKRSDEPAKDLPLEEIIDRIDGTVYVNHQDGTVTDTDTGLMWEQTDDGFRRNVYGAYQHCEDLYFAGYSDWRLPTMPELEEISNIGPDKLEPIICTVFDNKQAAYWTQTKSDLKLRLSGGATYYSSVNYTFSRDRNGLYGKSIDPANENSQRYARCVR